MITSRIKTVLLNIAGYTSIALGAAGIIVPLLPTTPFLLLAAICFSHSNPKIARWLRQSRVFGPYIENWYSGKRVSLQYKLKVVAYVWLGLGISIYMVEPIWKMVGLALIGTCVSIHIFCLGIKKNLLNHSK